MDVARFIDGIDGEGPNGGASVARHDGTGNDVGF